MTPITPADTLHGRGRLGEFLRRPGPRGADALLAAGLLLADLVLLVYVADPQGDHPAGVDVMGRPMVMEQPQTLTFWALLLALPTAVPVAWRRSSPIPAFAVQGMAVAATDSHDATMAAFMALAVGAYSVAAHVREVRTAAAAFGVATLLLALKFPAPDSGPPGMLPAAVMLAIWALGRTIGTWRTRAGALHGRALRAERAHAEAVARERARIARELHDVVSHNVSVMVIQSGAARVVLRSDPDAATEALHAVEAGGRETMAELRRMLDVLAAEHASPRVPGSSADAASDEPPGDALGPPLAPQPDLARLPVLVERVAAAGLDVRLRGEGLVRPLPPGVELTAYRVVQEALTNALKYAPGGRAEVCVAYGADVLRIEVADEGAADGRRPEAWGGGRGLVGLAERVALHGGELRAGRRPAGGYRLSAVIPVAADPEPPR
ncbi:sensor histidine kinase [Uniformispora flossi]|uniref:sensor histidine kinase n=1 Tax=Uniformispora flossi TaxID=3390723 RepID=UPI003C2B0C0D